jgi:protoheme IX farnesyltransferase
MKTISPAEAIASHQSLTAEPALSSAEAVSAGPPSAARSVAAAYLELTKPRITFLIVLTALAGFGLGASSPLPLAGVIHIIVGIGLLSSGLAALNQYLERDLDGLMRRTQHRPLPAARLSPGRALLFGCALSAVAEVYLALLVNPLTALLGLLAFASYLFLYTPLKTRSSLSTAVGAIPGAIPPLMGWAAARGELTLEGWVLFAILFLWQFPHFLAIAWLYREDYERAGIVMLPVIEPNGEVTGRQIVSYTLMLLPVSLIPAWLGMAGSIYFFGALALGVWFLYVSIRAAVSGSKAQARSLLRASVLYLPLLFALMVFNQL